MDIIIKESQYKTIISETAIPSGTYRNMKNNVSSDFYTDYEVLDYCNFLEYKAHYFPPMIQSQDMKNY